MKKKYYQGDPVLSSLNLIKTLMYFLINKNVETVKRRLFSLSELNHSSNDYYGIIFMFNAPMSNNLDIFCIHRWKHFKIYKLGL